MLSLLYSTVLLYHICFCFVLSCTLLIGGNKEILLLFIEDIYFFEVNTNSHALANAKRRLIG